LRPRQLEQHTELIERTLASIQFLPKPYVVEDFLTLTTRHFHQFRCQVLGEVFKVYKG